MSVSSPAHVPANNSLFAPERLTGTLALMLGVGSHAINGFVTTAVLPDIIRDLGGQDRAFWVFSSFEMMAILAGCLTGAAKVRFGARHPFLLASFLLASGSVLAGLSVSLEGLIAGRALQGFGEGMIIALCYSLIPDLFPSNIAPRVFAMLAAVWAVAAGIGPVSAGILSELWSWRAAFLINIPLVLLLFVLMNSALPASAVRPAPSSVSKVRKSPVRLLVRLGLLAASIFLLTVIGELHTALPLALTIMAGLATAAILLTYDAASPQRLFPRDAFRAHTLIGLGTWIVFLISAAAAVRAVFVTTVGQVYWALSVTQASYVAAGLAFSWSTFAFISSRAPSRQCELTYLTIGPFLIAGGLTLTAVAITTASLPLFALAAVVAGAGHGLCNQILMRSLMYTAEGEDHNLVSSILPTISSAGIAIGGGLTGLIAIVTGLVAPGSEELLTREAVARSGASIFYINAGLTLVPALAMLVLRQRLIARESVASEE
ncbi:MFS transporter [Stappia sp. BW2]|uniref:MFS transporter n=1 Tax=Stappia sp. BW2 TaxID=2592622 RepID=UPI0011DE95D0|nr:MFS transporter [Stappia sp. BW2]TYC64719.1 MFS transporter [Stappia sp. BW2]